MTLLSMFVDVNEEFTRMFGYSRWEVSLPAVYKRQTHLQEIRGEKQLKLL